MIKLTFLGDIMCKAEMIEPYRVADKKYDFSDIFEYAESLLRDSDLVCANLETPISFDNRDLTCAQWEFNSPYEFAEAVKKTGVDFVATANNHCLDRGISGIEATVKSLDSISILHTGVGEKEPCIVVCRGTRIGILAYTYGTNAFSNHCYLDAKHRNWVNLFQNQELSNPITRYCYYNGSRLIPRIYNGMTRRLTPEQWSRPIHERREFSGRCMRRLKKDIKKLKQQDVHHIVMYMHIGGQYNAQPTLYTKQMVKQLKKWGVDIIVGTHEHVIHGGEFDYSKTGNIAAYSLGNFVGVAGVSVPPYDKFAQYSIVWNVFLDNGVIAKSTFHVCKVIDAGNQKIKVVPAYELYQNETDEDLRIKLKCEIIEMASRFSGVIQSEVLPEYVAGEAVEL